MAFVAELFGIVSEQWDLARINNEAYVFFYQDCEDSIKATGRDLRDHGHIFVNGQLCSSLYTMSEIEIKKESGKEVHIVIVEGTPEELLRLSDDFEERQCYELAETMRSMC